MSLFDAEIFAHTLLREIRAMVQDMLPRNKNLEGVIRAMALDIEASFAALEIETDSKRAQRLRNNLLSCLTERRQAALLALREATFVASDIRDMSQNLDAVEFAAVAAAAAFVA